MYFAVEHPNFWSDLILILGIIFMAQGLIQLFTKKLIGKEYNEFTEESKKRFVKPASLCYLVAGCAMVLSFFVKFEASPLITPILMGIIAVGAVVALLVFASKTLKPLKTTKTSSTSSKKLSKSTKTPKTPKSSNKKGKKN